MAKPPKGDTGSLQPTREPIIRGVGVTPSEQHLARLAERSFLNLWSFPNPFRDQRGDATGDGKELCDLLIVCGDHVLIFSEKTYSWPDVEDQEVAWCRWFKKAVAKSADQTKGAERWLKEFPDRVFLDAACIRPLPVELPPQGRRRVHRIVVAGGAGAACKQHFRGGIGSFAIAPDIKGSDHWDRAKGVRPFWIGDIDPDGSFVHVFDDGSLNVIMRELDTITDFTDYLEKKEQFIRSGRLSAAHGEEDLLAYYAVRINEHGGHDFAHPDERPWRAGDRIAIDGTNYASFVRNPQYRAKKDADKVSYVWDALIETFSKHLLGGTSLVPPWQDFDLRKSERGLREMALESRFERRSHGEAIVGAFEESKRRMMFFRAMLPGANSRNRGTGFFMLTVAYHARFDESGGYDEYRLFRCTLGELYAKGLLLRHPHLDKIVGIITEPAGRHRGSSEDLLYGERRDWTDDEKAEILADCKRLNILRPDYTERRWEGQEFPEVSRPPHAPSSGPPQNRKARRAAQAKARKGGG